MCEIETHLELCSQVFTWNEPPARNNAVCGSREAIPELCLCHLRLHGSLRTEKWCCTLEQVRGQLSSCRARQAVALCYGDDYGPHACRGRRDPMSDVRLAANAVE